MKRFVSVLLALLLCVSLTVPALAVGDVEADTILELTVEQGIAPIGLEDEKEQFYRPTVTEKFDIAAYNLYGDQMGLGSLNGYHCIRSNDRLVISNKGGLADCTVTVMADVCKPMTREEIIATYYSDYSDAYLQEAIEYGEIELPEPGKIAYTYGSPGYCLMADGSWELYVNCGGDGELALQEGQSFTFSLPERAEEGDVIRIWCYADYPELDQNFYWYINFKVDTDAVEPALAERTKSIVVDGKLYEVNTYSELDANNNETNYMRLRDLAYILNGSAAQFNVGWDGAINILDGQAYSANGTELEDILDGSRPYKPVTQAIKLDGVKVDLKGYNLIDDRGNDGNTYYQIRDVAKLLGFYVGWDYANQCILVETNKPYSEK